MTDYPIDMSVAPIVTPFFDPATHTISYDNCIPINPHVHIFQKIFIMIWGASNRKAIYLHF